MSITDKDKHAFSSSEDISTLAKGTGFSLFGQIAQVIITYAYGIVIARFLGVSNYGIFFLGITIFNLVAILSQCGIEDGLVRFIGFYTQRGDRRRAKGLIHSSLFLAAVLGVLFGGICFLSADLLAEKIFHKPELGTVLRYLSLATPIYSVLIVSVASIRSFKIVMPYVLVRKIFMPLISLVLAIAVLAMGYGLLGLTGSYILAVGCSAALAIFLLISFLSRFKEERSSMPELDRYFSFVSSAFLVNILFFLINWCDLIILGIFWPAQEVGIYFASKKTALTLNFFLISLNAIFAPVSSHLYSSNKHTQLNHAYKTTTQWMLMLSLPFFLIMVFFSNEILSLFGSVFKEGRICLIILALGQIINASCGSNGNLLMMTGRQKWMVYNSIIFLILAISLTVVLVPHYGMLGAACANGAVIIFANVVTTAEVYFLLRFHPYNFYYFKILFSGAITAGFFYIVQCYLPNNGSAIVSLMGATSIFVIFFVLVILFGLEESQRKFLIAIKEKLMPSYAQESFGGRK